MTLKARDPNPTLFSLFFFFQMARLLLLCAVLKMSDVGHTAKGKKNRMKWTEKIMEEFFCQGEKEMS